MRKILIKAAATAALGLMLTAPAIATTFVETSDREMAIQSDSIIVGRVTNSRSQWVGKQLITVVEMRVSETIKGDKKSKIEVVLPGGTDLKRAVPVSMTYPGAPTLRLNESVVLFLKKTSLRPGAMVISGFSQGKYNVVTDSAGRTVVTRSGSGATPSVRSRSLLSAHNHAGRRTLGEFRLEIRDYLNRRAP